MVLTAATWRMATAREEVYVVTHHKSGTIASRQLLHAWCGNDVMTGKSQAELASWTPTQVRACEKRGVHVDVNGIR
eukprot:CAMPEP_0197406926 /NCGR_PEP_ID=MMETSP1165-20131217/26391_1 /TAXON_ID=284809 /ORGANISM="Chrysocystis fragilis, Strain CCMP3189" /LENGTH=75 /DNA_ID=CAMNT_0042933291 /DNA_START=60 /DNA_END=284 /DNA_ORIENTATION=+